MEAVNQQFNILRQQFTHQKQLTTYFDKEINIQEIPQQLLKIGNSNIKKAIKVNYKKTFKQKSLILIMENKMIIQPQRNEQIGIYIPNISENKYIKLYNSQIYINILQHYPVQIQKRFSNAAYIIYRPKYYIALHRLKISQHPMKTAEAIFNQKQKKYPIKNGKDLLQLNFLKDQYKWEQSNQPFQKSRMNFTTIINQQRVNYYNNPQNKIITVFKRRQMWNQPQVKKKLQIINLNIQDSKDCIGVSANYTVIKTCQQGYSPLLHKKQQYSPHRVQFQYQLQVAMLQINKSAQNSNVTGLIGYKKQNKDQYKIIYYPQSVNKITQMLAHRNKIISYLKKIKITEKKNQNN